MTSARADVSKKMMTSAKSRARGSAWRRVTDTGGAWRRVTRFGGAWRRVTRFGGACRRVQMMPRFLVARGRSDEDEISQKGRSERLLSNDAICGLIGEAEAMVAARQFSLMYWSCGEGSDVAHKNGYRGHPRRQDCLRAAHQRIRAVALIPC